MCSLSACFPFSTIPTVNLGSSPQEMKQWFTCSTSASVRCEANTAGKRFNKMDGQEIAGPGVHYSTARKQAIGSTGPTWVSLPKGRKKG